MSLPFTLRNTVVPVITGSKQRLLFPVRRIYCIGQNYESHAREMGGHPSKNNPFFFAKPTDALVTVSVDNGDAGATPAPYPTSVNSSLSIRYPSVTESYHHEVELVVAIGPRHSSLSCQNDDGAQESDEASLSYFNLPVEEADDVIYAYGVGLDMTRRDMQAQAKENGLPWDLAKGGDDCAVVSPLVLAQDLRRSHPALFECPGCPTTVAGQTASMGTTAPERAGVGCEPLTVNCGEIYLSVNGNARQRANMNCMINTPAEIIAILSRLVTLHAGDLIFTGTPSGVGPVRRGDVITAGIDDIGEITVTVD